MRPQQPQLAIRAKVSARCTRPRPAFTLVELVVSVGILVMMLTMAGTVFSLTLRSTGQAKALTDVTQRLRVFEQTLAEDLRDVRRGASKMVIESHGVRAYWTEAQKELDAAGDPTAAALPSGGDPERTRWDAATNTLRPELPRADVLLFFSARPGRSYLDPAVQAGAQMLVYGHAEVGEMEEQSALPGWRWRSPVEAFESKAGSTKYTTYAESTDNTLPRTVFPRPARSWHLARRSVVVVNRWPAPTAPSLPYYANRPSDPKLLTGERDILGLDPSYPAPFQYAKEIARGIVPAQDVAGGNPIPWYLRSRLDLTPPARLAGRMGACFLPNCASFKVEWALPLSRLPDPMGVLVGVPTVWIDPYRDRTQLADPRDKPDWVKQLEIYFDEKEGDGLVQRYYRDNLPVWQAWRETITAITSRANGRFVGRTWHEWFAEDPGLSASKTPGDPDPYFPTALRITVDVYDDAARLDRPIRHTMVIPVGEG